jgi:wobble nucleotide-excising tRNase
MIDRFISIKGIGRFENCAASGNVAFKKYTLIFAENGHGKTTLCDIIRSMQTGDPGFILGRRTLGSSVEPSVNIRLTNGSNATFSKGKWTATADKVTIFDAIYVRDNVHAGEVVDIGQKRNLFQVIVGEEGVKLSREFDSIEKQRTELNAPIRSLKATIDAALPAGMKITAFLKLAQDPEIDGKISIAERELAAASQSTTLKAHSEFLRLTLPAVSGELLSALALTLDGVAETAEKRMHEHVARLKSSDSEPWLAKGLELLHDDTCPFCAQQVKENDLIAAYKACFSAAYNELTEKLCALGKDVDAKLGEAATAQLAKIIAQNDSNETFWSNYCALDALPPMDITAVSAAMVEAAAAAKEILAVKASNPLATVDAPRLIAAMAALERAVAPLNAYNNVIEARNRSVQALKTGLNTSSLSEAQKALTELKALKGRFVEPLLATCNEYNGKIKERDDLEDRKTAIRKQLDDYTNATISSYQGSLNKYLGLFAAGFEIQGIKAEFPKGLANSNYQIVINGVAVDVGNESSLHHQPSFRNTLSGGDRSALALSLFMSQLERVVTPPDIAVLLDDPFQSQDNFRRTSTAFRIKECGTCCGQVVVLSHDPSFLKLVWDELPKDQRKSLRLMPVTGSTVIAEWDIYEHMKGELQANLETVQRYVDRGEGKDRDVAQKLRPLLESYCKVTSIGDFPDGMMMGDMIDKVRTTGPTHVLHKSLPNLEELNSYARRYHHGTNSDAAAEPLGASELRGYCVRIINLVRGKH